MTEEQLDNAEKAIHAVCLERKRQNEKWGEQNHDIFVWLAILHEETGELSEAALHEIWGSGGISGVFEETVQVAAVALQIVEYLIRKKNA